MEGFSRNPNASTSERGIIPRAIEQIFSHIAEHASARMRFLVRASYLQIYNEAISDLLKSERANLAIEGRLLDAVWQDYGLMGQLDFGRFCEHVMGVFSCDQGGVEYNQHQCPLVDSHFPYSLGSPRGTGHGG